LTHAIDRGKLSNEREYEGIFEIWKAFVATYNSVFQAILAFVQHPNLNNMEVRAIEDFLTTTNLSNEQKIRVVESKDRNDTYARIVNANYLTTAQDDLRTLSNIVITNGIFLPSDLMVQFQSAIKLMSNAWGQRYTEFGGRSLPEHRGISDFLEHGDGLRLRLLESIKRRIFKE
jgi:hypothetical protein